MLVSSSIPVFCKYLKVKIFKKYNRKDHEKILILQAPNNNIELSKFEQVRRYTEIVGVNNIEYQLNSHP